MVLRAPCASASSGWVNSRGGVLRKRKVAWVLVFDYARRSTQLFPSEKTPETLGTSKLEEQYFEIIHQSNKGMESVMWINDQIDTLERVGI